MINFTTNIELINSFLSRFNTHIKNISVYSKYLVYKNNNNVIGFLDFSFIYDRIEINYIYVNNDFRNKNIASELINKLIQYSTDNKCLNITLEVNETNINAINLYKKFKFKIVAKRKNYYENNDGLLMIREMV